MDPILGWLVLVGWHGVSRQRVLVVGQTPKRWRIQAIDRTKLAGRSRWLEPGQEALVPTNAVQDNCEECHGAKGGAPGNENRVGNRVVCDYCLKVAQPKEPR